MHNLIDALLERMVLQHKMLRLSDATESIAIHLIYLLRDIKAHQSTARHNAEACCLCGDPNCEEIRKGTAMFIDQIATLAPDLRPILNEFLPILRLTMERAIETAKENGDPIPRQQEMDRAFEPL